MYLVGFSVVGFAPQTIFMEMIFRKIEYWIEGDRNKQMKLDKQEWNAEKDKKTSFEMVGIFTYRRYHYTFYVYVHRRLRTSL